MSGHNKWSQIKRQKGAVDAKRSKLFSILTKNIQLEAKKAKGDRNSVGLKTIIERARAANLPNENIDRAIKAATDTSGLALKAVRYEAYGPEGIAIIIEAITDSKNRTAQEIKHLLGENGAALAAPGSAVWAFDPPPPVGGGEVNPPAGGETKWRPKMVRSISAEALAALQALVEKLEARDDVQTVSFDANLPPREI